MANLKFVTVLFLSYMAIQSPYSRDELDLSSVVFMNQLLSISFDNVCDRAFLTNFHRIFNLKSFVNYEARPRAKFPEITGLIKSEIHSFIDVLKKGIKLMEKEIPEIDKFPHRYIPTKLNHLMSSVNTITGYMPKTSTMAALDLATFSKKADDLKDMKAELLVKNPDLVYLTDAKEQYLNALEDNGGKLYDLHDFQENLLPTLRRILYHVLGVFKQTGKLDPVKLDYLINFFNVFGTLIPDDQYAQMVLEFLVGTDPMPKFKDPAHPDFFKNPELFNLDNQSQNPYQPIIGMDKLFHTVDGNHRNLRNIINAYKGGYSFHPDWIKFFDIEGKKNPLTHEDPNMLEKITQKGHRYIYYLYAHYRSLNEIPRGANLPEVAQILYDKLLENSCFLERKDKCPLNLLIPQNKFNKYYIIMLTLLKPQVKTNEGYTPEEVQKIMKNNAALGMEEANKYIPSIKASFPQFEEAHTTATMNEVANQITELIGDELEEKDPHTEKVIPPIKLGENEEEDPKSSKFDTNPAPITDPNHQKLEEILEKKDKKIQEKVEKLIPGFFTPPNQNDPEEMEKKLDQVTKVLTTALGLDNKPAIPVIRVAKKAINNFIKSKEAGTPEYKEFVSQVKKTYTQTITTNIHNLYPIFDNSGFVRYLLYTIRMIENEQTNRNDKELQNFFNFPTFNRIRLMDIIVFVYYTKYFETRETNPDYADEWVQNTFMPQTQGQLLYEIMESEEFMNSETSVTMMAKYMSIFEHFEYGKTKGIEEAFGRDNFGSTFNHIYKFIIETRMFMRYVDSHPDKALWKSLKYCINKKHDDILSNKSFFTDMERSLNDPNKEIQTDYSGIVYPSPCRQSYADLNEIYPFIAVHLHANDENMVFRHAKFMESKQVKVIIKSDIFYRYVYEEKNSDLSTLFTSFCGNDKSSLCYGYDTFTKVVTIIKDGKTIGSLSNDISKRQFIVEKLKELKIHLESDPDTFYFMYWNILSGMTSWETKYQSSYELSHHFGEIALLEFKEIMSSEQIKEKLDNNTVIDMLSKYLALRFSSEQPNSTKEFKYRQAFNIFSKDETMKSLIMLGGNYNPHIARLFANNVINFEAYQRLAKIIVEAGQLPSVFIFSNGFTGMEMQIFNTFNEKHKPSEIGNLIIAFLKDDLEKSKTSQKVAQGGKKKTGANTKFGALNKKPATNLATKFDPEVEKKIAQVVVTNENKKFLLTVETEIAIKENQETEKIEHKDIVVVHPIVDLDINGPLANSIITISNAGDSIEEIVLKKAGQAVKFETLETLLRRRLVLV